jgi:hypothetical protein
MSPACAPFKPSFGLSGVFLPQPGAVELRAMKAIYESSSYIPTQQDLFFNAAFEKVFGDALEYGFYLTLAGVSHRNPDGTSRRRLIDECTVGDILTPVREPENPYDPNAVAVKRRDGAQIGYLPARVAAEAVSAAKHGTVFLAAFRCQTLNPETGKTVGALILLLFLKKNVNGLDLTDEMEAAIRHQLRRYGISL